MMIKATFFAVLMTWGFGFRQGVAGVYLTGPLQDSLPPLHTIKERDIDSLGTSFEDHILTVKLKNGITYTYQHEDWDMEAYDASLNKKLREALNHLIITFTRVEHAPEFPGGDEAWDKYIKEFCIQHKDAIEEYGAGEITLQFIVHMKGQITDMRVVSTKGRAGLIAIAEQAIQDGPAWVTATQNGHKVVSYKMQVVKLGVQ